MEDPITIETIIARDVGTVWRLWAGPEYIQAWNHASDGWESPKVENNLWVDEYFSAIMRAKDGAVLFDFNGTYTAVDHRALIEYVIEGDREVSVRFVPIDEGTRVIEMFEPEDVNSRDLRESGWQSILDSFKRYVEPRWRQGLLLISGSDSCSRGLKT